MSPSRVVVVSGASSGIGRSAALALAERGFHVYAGVRDATAGEGLVATAAPDVTIEPILLDVTDADQIAATTALLGARHGAAGLHGLVNNAGIAVGGPLEYLPLDALRTQLEVNVVGQLALTQALLPLLRQARGRIVITGSDSGFFASPLLGAYSMSKFAMEAFADTLRRELRPSGIRVSLLQPGAIATDIWGKGIAELSARLEGGAPGQSERYGPLLDRVRAMAEEEARTASPPSVVARDVVHALTARRPRTRYLRGRGARQFRILSLLPDRMVDAVIRRQLRW